jgi:glycosyltransferase involved in cell wall biosynthesis
MRAVGTDRWSVVVAMPAHDEECLAEFVAEIDAHLRPHVSSLRYVVVDDASTVPVSVDGVGAGHARVLANPTNLGHGPSALRAWSAAADLAPDVVIHVDGDGQFLGSDFPRLLVALRGHDAALGVRVGRTDPWFRKVISRGLTFLLPPQDRGHADVNTPLRAYRTAVVRDLLARVPADALVPHVHWTLLHRPLGLRVGQVEVTSLPRRGASTVGTSWRSPGVDWLPSRRLIRFVRRALVEVWRMRVPVVRAAPTPVVVDDTAA